MERVKWPEGKKSAVMFSFDLDGDVIWRNMSADEPNAEKLIRAPFYRTVRIEPLCGHDNWDLMGQ